MNSTVFLTVISGTSVYVIGQIINKFYIEPIYRIKKTIGKISDALLFYCNLYTSPVHGTKKDCDRPIEREEAHKIFRDLACEITSRSNQIPSYRDFVFLKIVPNKKDIFEIRANLIGLSNSMRPESSDLEYNNRRVKELEKLLDLTIE